MYIFKHKISHYTAQAIKVLKVVFVLTLVLSSIVLIKFKPAYEVYLNGEAVGYANNKDKFQQEIQDSILTTSEDNVAFVALDNVTYKLSFVSRKTIDEGETLTILKANSTKVYRVYEVADETSGNTVYVNSQTEAEALVENLKEQYSDISPDLKITTLYLNNEVSDETIQQAKNKITDELNAKLAEEEEEKSKTVNGVYLACLPVSGNITSRFGSRESIRNHTHKGIDISAPYGASIKAVADGTIVSAGWTDGGYGNLVVIDHGNGITTYYGHCSKVCVTAGQKVSAGDVIAAVGSTGNSTGNHLHFEVRINDVQVNPQAYIYK